MKKDIEDLARLRESGDWFEVLIEKVRNTQIDYTFTKSTNTETHSNWARREMVPRLLQACRDCEPIRIHLNVEACIDEVKEEGA